MARQRRYCYVDDCAKPVNGHGLCNKHYLRWKRYGRTHLIAEQPRRGRGPHLPLPERLSRDQWLIYAAGFIDGEGCINIQFRRKTRTHYLKLTVPQLNPAPLHILQSLFGGAVRPKAGRGTQYRRLWIWEAAAKQAAIAISEIAPYLVVKADEAAAATEFQRGIGRAISRAVTPTELHRREALKQRLEELKARHYV